MDHYPQCKCLAVGDYFRLGKRSRELVDVWPPILDIHWRLHLGKCARMEVLSDAGDPSMRQSGVNRLFCYEADVAVCISVHAYMSKEGETEREKTVNETDLCQTFCLQTITKYPIEICQISDTASSSPTWGETDIFTKMILIWSELLFRKSCLMTTVSERFKISYFKISKVNLFLPDLDTYVIQDGWNIHPHDFLAMHDSTWYSPASNFHIDLSQKRQEFVSWVPSHMFHWQGTESQHCISIFASVHLEC